MQDEPQQQAKEELTFKDVTAFVRSHIPDEEHASTVGDAVPAAMHVTYTHGWWVAVAGHSAPHTQ